jgi:hypothetical protein
VKGGRSRRFVLAGLTLVGATAGRPPAASAAEPAASPDPTVHEAPLPDTGLGYRAVMPALTLPWLAFQLLPSPQLAVGRQRRIDAAGSVDDSPKTAFGLRWQLTPVLWSFGVHRSQPRWRWFVVDPLARQSGSLELSASFEYIGGHVDRVLARPALRVYLPVAQRGENLSVSLGTSVYDYDGLRVAYEVGAYVLSGTLGLQVAVAPTHDPLAAIATIRVRYF